MLYGLGLEAAVFLFLVDGFLDPMIIGDTDQQGDEGDG